eukprot:TRINITY_DN6641_c0_g1_i1.p1 TRINITY_DN6641_c0_g1~~TRINITY_DN6641_c0_g1_i1.p1  ORF type:complete len:181 (-),score=13.41 TRINITY_DN6641_c0_g1_i1:20-562(-)
MDTTTQLIGLCLDLYAKLETMQENKEECEDVQLRLKAIEEFLKDMQSKKNNANDNGVLDYLEKQLVFAQKIIESQQRKKSCIDPIVLFFCADKYKADLEKVNQRLSEAINQLNLPNTKVLLDIQQQLEKQANMRSPKVGQQTMIRLTIVQIHDHDIKFLRINIIRQGRVFFIRHTDPGGV